MSQAASRLSSLLVRDGVVHVRRMEQAFQRQVIYGGSLDTILLEMASLPEERLLPYLSLACGLPPADDALLAPFQGRESDPRIVALCPVEVADQFFVVPLGFEGDALRIVVTDPVDMTRLEGFATRIRTPVQPFVAAEYRYHVLREQVYGVPTPSRYAQLATKHDASIVRRGSAQIPAEQPPAEPVATLTPLSSTPVVPAPVPVPAPAPAPPPLAETGPSTPSRFEPSPLTVQEASALMARSVRRDDIFAALLRAARGLTWYAGLLIVRGGEAVGRMAIEGRRAELDDIGRVHIPLDQASAFATAIEGGSPYMGPVRTDRESLNDVLRLMGGVVPPAALLLPIVIRTRVIAVVYAHRGADSLSIGEVASLLPLATDAGMALSKIIIRAKTNPLADSTAPAPPPEPAPAPAPAVEAVPEPVPAVITDKWGTNTPQPPAFGVAPAAPPPPAPVPAAIGRLLDLVEAAQEPTASIARDEASHRLDELIPELERRFPGRLTVDRHRAGSSTLRAAQYGPLLGFAVELGGPAIPLLRDELRSGDREKRYYAAVALGEIRDPIAVPDLVGLVFDGDYGVRAAALEAIVAFPAPLVDSSLESVRHALLEPPPRSRAAAFALGELRDVRSVPILVDALIADDATAVEAHRALVQITKQDFGTKVRKWSSWWNANQRASRVEWMLEGLGHGEEPLRRSSIDELRRLTGETFGYRHDAPRKDRDRARKAWQAWWDETGHRKYGA